MAGDTERMREFWDERAREDAFYFVDNRQRYRSPDLESFWESAAAVEYMLDGLGVKLQGADSVLEIGCGVGRVTRWLAARTGHVVALDVSHEMLTRARLHNPELGNVRWVLGDGVSLATIPDESVDACVSVVVFQHLPDASITLGYVREIGRALRPQGWAALQISNDPEIHRPSTPLRWRLNALLGRGPKGHGHPAWLGSHVDLDALRDAALDGAMEVEKVWGAGSQYCQILLRKKAKE